MLRKISDSRWALAFLLVGWVMVFAGVQAPWVLLWGMLTGITIRDEQRERRNNAERD